VSCSVSDHSLLEKVLVISKDLVLEGGDEGGQHGQCFASQPAQADQQTVAVGSGDDANDPHNVFNGLDEQHNVELVVGVEVVVVGEDFGETELQVPPCRASSVYTPVICRWLPSLSKSLRRE
jgi:hypothetical protein